MRRIRKVETRSDRAELAADAGVAKVSFVSVLAGTLVAYGTFAIAAAIAGAAAQAGSIATNLGTTNVERVGIAGAVLVGAVLFTAYLFGGYVAGRMARRAGAANGLLVFFLGGVVAGGIGILVRLFADTSDIVQNLRNIGFPTSGQDVRDAGALVAVVSIVAMMLGSVLGGIAGERWHGSLVARALDPQVGAGVPARVDGHAAETINRSAPLSQASETSSSRSSDQ